MQPPNVFGARSSASIADFFITTFEARFCQQSILTPSTQMRFVTDNCDRRATCSEPSGNYVGIVVAFDSIDLGEFRLGAELIDQQFRCFPGTQKRTVPNLGQWKGAGLP